MGRLDDGGAEKLELLSKICQCCDVDINLRDVFQYSAYTRGAVDAILMMQRMFPALTGGGKDKPYNEAVLRLITSSKRNAYLFLMETQMSFRNFVKNKKGKLLSCEAYFCKEVVRREEIL